MRAAGSGYAGKPRPAVIVQSDAFPDTDSVTVVMFTTTEIEADLFRIGIEPSPANGLAQRSWLMADKVTSVRRASLRGEIGRLDPLDMQRLDAAMRIFLGLGD